MKRTPLLLAGLLAATLIGGSSTASIASTEHCPDKDSPNKVEAQGSELDGIVLEAGTIVCVKGSTDATGKVVADGTSTLRQLLGNGHSVSYYITYPGRPPRTLSPGNAYVKSYGPKGDPWYRFTFFNPASRDRDNATCKVVFTGRDGQRVVRRKLSDGQGYKTRWLFVRGSTRVRMVCYEGGQLVFKRTFRSAPGGYYGPLYYGYRAGYFKL